MSLWSGTKMTEMGVRDCDRISCLHSPKWLTERPEEMSGKVVWVVYWGSLLRKLTMGELDQEARREPQLYALHVLHPQLLSQTKHSKHRTVARYLSEGEEKAGYELKRWHSKLNSLCGVGKSVGTAAGPLPTTGRSVPWRFALANTVYSFFGRSFECSLSKKAFNRHAPDVSCLSIRIGMGERAS
jgi:hypothetical protein